jgi:uncharacterized protein YdeI (BOF family)
MKKFALALVSIAALSLTTVAHAQIIKNDTDADAAVGGAAGGTAGAIAGGIVFGPIGAIIGGFAGATIGASAGVQASSVEYVRLNPTEPVMLEGELEVGYVVPAEVTVAQIEGDPAYGYFYTNDRVYFVDLSNRTVVYSPGVVVAAE